MSESRYPPAVIEPVSAGTDSVLIRSLRKRQAMTADEALGMARALDRGSALSMQDLSPLGRAVVALAAEVDRLRERNAALAEAAGRWRIG